MARIRYLKPDFFIDPELCELSFSHRLAFAGLWCYADKAGRLRYEPKKLKIQVMPYDNVRMDQILIDLTKKPFIHIYEVENIEYIQIVNWDKHQNPHHTEKESVVPLFNSSLTVKKQSNNGEIKEECFIDAISSHISSHSLNKYDFEPLWIKYPKKLGKHDAQRHFKEQVKTDEDYAGIKKALENFISSDVVKGDPQFIPHGSTWFNNRWRDYIDIQVATGKSQAMLDMERMIEDDRKRGVSSLS